VYYLKEEFKGSKSRLEKKDIVGFKCYAAGEFER
jgi:hypothetical protein